MSGDAEFRAYVLEQLEGLGPFESRRMFGGLALLTDGKAFAKVKHGALWLRADDASRNHFLDHGMPQYVYGKNNDRRLGFYQTPAEVIEDAEKLSDWVATAIEVARRS